MNPWLGMALVLVVLGGCLAALHFVPVLRKWHPELSRKSVHVAMGLTALAFPWLFRDIWPVTVLCGASIALLALLRAGPLRNSLGTVLGGVNRISLGEFCFPFSILLLFAVAGSETITYVVPILILTLADATCALVGVRYGVKKYATDDGHKSFEGSVTFFLVAFVSSHLALLLFTSVGRLESVLIGLLLGLVLMFTEAVSWKGLDNLFVPLGSYVCLVRFLTFGVPDLLFALLILCGLLFLSRLLARFTYLTPSALMAALLVIYYSWVAGGVHWLVAPGVALLAYLLMCPEAARVKKTHNVEAIACVGSTGLVWLAATSALGTVNTVYPYGVGYGCHIAIMALTYQGHHARNRPPVFKVMVAVLAACAPLALAYAWFWRDNPFYWQLTGGALLLCAAGSVAFLLLQPGRMIVNEDSPRWLRQGLVAALVSLPAFAWINYLEPWTKSFY